MTKHITRSNGNIKFAGAKSIAWTMLWIGFTVFILNAGLIVATYFASTPEQTQHIENLGDIPQTWFFIVGIVVSVFSLFLMSGLSILVFPLNRTLKKENTKSAATFALGIVIWVLTVFFFVMFFINLIIPVSALAQGAGLQVPTPIGVEWIIICNYIMSCIPVVAFVIAGFLYWRVDKAYSKRRG